MAGILDLLNGELGKTIVSGIAGQTGQDTNKTSSVLKMALPVLMQAMSRNASTSQGAEGLMGALNNKHDGSILDNLEGLFGGGVDSNVLDDGDKILNHVLGNKQSNVENVIGQQSGLDANSVAQILKVAAPILMGNLGKQSRQKNVSNSSGLGGLLGGILNDSSQQQEQSLLESILDADGDGSMIDDVAGMLLDSDKKKGDLDGLLGDLMEKL